jgi:class 3 adenylate cyclase
LPLVLSAPLAPVARAAIAAAPDAERRQLTVMFCDLVGSTALSTGMDPEDLRDVITSFQNRCSAAIRRYDGFVAKYMGDGILFYFGYPRAHEDEVERSARAGLDILDAMAELNAAVPRPPGVELAVRIGIATGPVIVGDQIGEGTASETGGRRRDAEPGGASAGAGAAEPDRRQLGHARDARRSLRPR